MDWQRSKLTLTYIVETPFGRMVAGKNMFRLARIPNGHKVRSRHTSREAYLLHRPKVPALTQGAGFKRTCGYKFSGHLCFGSTRKEFFGDSLRIVQLLVENHYRQLLKQALNELENERGNNGNERSKGI